MWKGRSLQMLGLWLIITAFVHHSQQTTAWINIITGSVVAGIGAHLRQSKRWQGLTGYVAGGLLILLAFVPSLTVHHVNVWIAGLAGLVIWFSGWRIVVTEHGGPWRLKDRPQY